VETEEAGDENRHKAGILNLIDHEALDCQPLLRPGNVLAQGAWREGRREGRKGGIKRRG